MSENTKNQNQKQEERKFTGIWIPREIWEAEDLSLLAKMLWAEIHALSGKDECWASNAFFAKRFSINERNIQKNLKILKDKDLIIQTGFDGRKRYLKALYPNLRHSRHVARDTPEESQKTPIENNLDNKSISNDIDMSQAQELALSLLNAIKKSCPSFKSPSMESWTTEIDRMLRIDKRNPLEVKEIIEWLPLNDFWCRNILSALKLRKHFDHLWMDCKSNACKADKFRRFAWKLKKDINAQNLVIKNMSCIDLKLRKDLSFNMDYKTFCDALASWYNATIEEGDIENG